jgi:hypothetical protein
MCVIKAKTSNTAVRYFLLSGIKRVLDARPIDINPTNIRSESFGILTGSKELKGVTRSVTADTAIST